MNDELGVMNYNDVIKLLESNKNELGIKNWEKENIKDQKLKSYGVGLTVLRKLAKKIGKNRQLSLELWRSDIYDAKIISLLIDDPKEITIDQIEDQVENLEQGYLTHVFSSCDAQLAKVPFAVDIVSKWIKSDDSVRRQCSYGLIYELSKSKKKNAQGDEFFLSCLENIKSNFSTENTDVQMSMGLAIVGIGKRNLVLHKSAISLAKELGSIKYTTGSGKEEEYELLKHLNSDYLKDKLGL